MSFSVGDFVWLTTANLSMIRGMTRKFAPRWIGPFEVVGVVSVVSYRLSLPPRFSALHPVFHVSQLKPHHGPVRPAPEAVFTDAEGQEHFEVEAIITHRGNGRRRRFLVKWVGYESHDNTWEPESNLAGAADLLDAYRREHGL